LCSQPTLVWFSTNPPPPPPPPFTEHQQARANPHGRCLPTVCIRSTHSLGMIYAPAQWIESPTPPPEHRSSDVFRHYPWAVCLLTVSAVGQFRVYSWCALQVVHASVQHDCADLRVLHDADEWAFYKVAARLPGAVERNMFLQHDGRYCPWTPHLYLYPILSS
jgi:hypothetical protein